MAPAAGPSQTCLLPGLTHVSSSPAPALFIHDIALFEPTAEIKEAHIIWHVWCSTRGTPAQVDPAGSLDESDAAACFCLANGRMSASSRARLGNNTLLPKHRPTHPLDLTNILRPLVRQARMPRTPSLSAPLQSSPNPRIASLTCLMSSPTSTHPCPLSPTFRSPHVPRRNGPYILEVGRSHTLSDIHRDPDWWIRGIREQHHAPHRNRCHPPHPPCLQARTHLKTATDSLSSLPVCASLITKAAERPHSPENICHQRLAAWCMRHLSGPARVKSWDRLHRNSRHPGTSLRSSKVQRTIVALVPGRPTIPR